MLGWLGLSIVVVALAPIFHTVWITAKAFDEEQY